MRPLNILTRPNAGRDFNSVAQIPKTHTCHNGLYEEIKEEFKFNVYTQSIKLNSTKINQDKSRTL